MQVGNGRLEKPNVYANSSSCFMLVLHMMFFVALFTSALLTGCIRKSGIKTQTTTGATEPTESETSTVQPDDQSNAPIATETTETKKTSTINTGNSSTSPVISKTFSLSQSSVWTSDDASFAGFFASIPKDAPSFGTDLTITTKLLRSGNSIIGMSIDGTQSLAKPITVRLPTALVNLISGANPQDVVVEFTPTSSGVKTRLTTQDIAIFADKIFVSLEDWGVISVRVRTSTEAVNSSSGSTLGVPSLSYTGATGTSITAGQTLNVHPTTLSDNGAEITACAVKAGTTALPNWATLDAMTCVLSGTTNIPLTATNYTLVATNAIGNSADTVLTLSVNPAAGAPTVALGSPSASLTSTTSVTYTATYTNANAITLTASDVTLNKTGTADGVVSISGSGNSTRTVTINSISGNGTLGISIVGGTASNVAGDLGAASSASSTFTVDNTAPTLVISSPSVSVTASGSVTYTVTYTGADAISLANADVTLNKTGTADGSVAVTGSGTSTRTITISSITGNGTLGITLAAGTASDTAGNSAAASSASTTFSVDNTAPLTPSVSPGSQSFSSSFNATVTQNATTDANFDQFRYTISGSNPSSCSDGTGTSGTIAISGTSNVTLKVIACDTLGNYSSVVTTTYTYASATGTSASVSTFEAFPAVAPSDGTAKINVVAYLKNSSGTAMGTGKDVEITVSSANVTMTGGAACATPSTTCKKATDNGDGSYSVTAVSSTAASYTFTAAVNESPTVTLSTVPSVTFDTAQFTTISSTTTITNATHGGLNLYFTGGTATFDSTTEGMTFGHIFVAGGTLAHSATTSGAVRKLSINASSLTLQSGSINVNGLGYTAGYSYGSSAPSTSLAPTTSGNFRAGASHGGLGGITTSTVTTAGAVYGNYRDPSYPGGGAGNTVGGGVVYISSTGICTINSGASITANASGIASAGGSVYLNCGGFAGTAGTNAITANGGNAAGSNCTTASVKCGAGGGGRIALLSSGGSASFKGSFAYPSDSTSLTSFKTKVRAYGGVGVSSSFTNGGAGTIYLKHSGLTYGDLIVDNSQITTGYASDGTSFLPSLAGTITSTPSGSSLPVTVSSSPGLAASYAGLYKGLLVRPKLAYTNGTANDWTDDNVLTISTNDATTLTATATISGVAAADSFRSIDIFDHLDIGGRAILSSNGDIYVVNGPLSSPGGSLSTSDGFLQLNGSASIYPSISLTTLSSGTFDISTIKSQSVTVAGATVTGTSYSSTGTVTVSSGSLTVPSITAGYVSVSGGTLTTSTLTISHDLTISGGTLEHSATTSTVMQKLEASIGGDLSLTGGSINVNGLGYLPGYSYDPTGPSTALAPTVSGNNKGGASHGGMGGITSGTLAGAVYDDYRNPAYPGGGIGFAGGGVVRISAAGLCTINSGASIKASAAGAGGAGGSIYLNCNGFAGTAAGNAIIANGGAGVGSNCSTASAACGGGGGGRIAMISSGNASSFSGSFAYPTGATALTNFKAKVRAWGGVGAAANTNGGAGTIYLKHSGLSYGDLIIDAGSPSSVNATDGKTVLLAATDNTSRIYSSTDANNVNVTNGSTPYTNMINLYANALIHVFPVTGGSANPLDSSHTAVTLTSNAANTFTAAGSLFPTIAASDYYYRFTYRLDHIDVGGKANVDMNGADLILQSCDLHSTTATTFDVPSGSLLSGNSLASASCLNASVTTKASTVSFSNYYLP